MVYVPDECKPKDATGSEDDMYCRMKQTEPELPIEHNGAIEGYRSLGSESPYDQYGYCGG